MEVSIFQDLHLIKNAAAILFKQIKTKAQCLITTKDKTILIQ